TSVLACAYGRYIAGVRPIYGRGSFGERGNDRSSSSGERPGRAIANGRAPERHGSFPGRASLPADPGPDHHPEAGTWLGDRGGAIARRARPGTNADPRGVAATGSRKS